MAHNKTSMLSTAWKLQKSTLYKLTTIHLQIAFPGDSIHLACKFNSNGNSHLTTKNLVDGSRFLEGTLIDNFWPHLFHKKHERIQWFLYVHLSQSASTWWGLARTDRLLRGWTIAIRRLGGTTYRKPNFLAARGKRNKYAACNSKHIKYLIDDKKNCH